MSAAAHLREAARALSAAADELDLEARAEAASAPAPRAPAPASRPAPRPAASDVLVPFGRDAGRPLTEVDDKALVWLAGAVQKSIDDPERAQYRRKNIDLLAAVRAEQDARFVR
jgi:hypothetical protein